MLRSSGRRIDMSTAFVDAMPPDVSRQHVVIPDVTGQRRRRTRASSPLRRACSQAEGDARNSPTGGRRRAAACPAVTPQEPLGFGGDGLDPLVPMCWWLSVCGLETGRTSGRSAVVDQLSVGVLGGWR
jgi:hypothetical protein